MNARPAAEWIVLKFGGTSVSSLANWRNIAKVVRERGRQNARVLVVHSAVSGITDRLEKLLSAALAGEQAAVLDAIEERHRQLATELGIGASPALEQIFAELRQVIAGIVLTGEVSERTRARVMASGELMATEIGARFLQSAGIECRWWDPRCILPARQAQIPIWIYDTQTPHLEGTHISGSGGDGAAQVKAVCIKKGITLVSLETPGMWHEVGFLADAFHIFKRHGMSVDQVSTSETSITVSLDPAANTLDRAALDTLVAELGALCRVQVLGPCASVSLVGRNIRGILHQLGAAFELFADQRIYMVSQAANDLNFIFVVDEEQGDRLVQELHDLLIRPVSGDTVLGPTWAELYGREKTNSRSAVPWWQLRRAELLRLAAAHESAFVYDPEQVRLAARALRALKSVQRVYYAMKANPHPALLRIVAEEGLGIECVSRGEIERVCATLPGLDRARVLYTPNFAARDEYAWAFAQGVSVTIDNLYVLQAWPEVFRDREWLVRVDTGTGRGHHQHVRTPGGRPKFCIPLAELETVAQLAAAAGGAVVRPP